jgi:hypothetical protein
VRAAFCRTNSQPLNTNFAPVLIGIGLLTLLSRSIWQAAPMATAFAIIALGATIATANLPQIARSRTIIGVQVFVYASLYLLFVGAFCDAAVRGPSGALTIAQLIDLTVSTGVMASAARSGVAALFRPTEV